MNAALQRAIQNKPTTPIFLCGDDGQGPTESTLTFNRKDAEGAHLDGRSFRSLFGEHTLYFRHGDNPDKTESLSIKLNIHGQRGEPGEEAPQLSKLAKDEFWKLAFLIEASPRMLAAVKALLASPTELPDALRLELEVSVAEAECGRPTV